MSSAIETMFIWRLYAVVFPEKNLKGDRVPTRKEILSCSAWLEEAFALLQPRLVIPIGKLAIGELLPVKQLTDVVGRQFEQKVVGCFHNRYPAATSLRCFDLASYRVRNWLTGPVFAADCRTSCLARLVWLIWLGLSPGPGRSNSGAAVLLSGRTLVVEIPE